MSTLRIIGIVILLNMSGISASDTDSLTEKKIFEPGRMWTYKMVFIDSNRDTLDSQTLELKVLEEMKGRTRLIEWKKYSKNDALPVISTKTGVSESKYAIAFPMPGADLSPFPAYIPFYIRRPFLKEGRKWETSKVVILRQEDFCERVDAVEVKFYYEVIGQKDVSTLLMDFPGCWQTDTKAESKKGVYKAATYYFHPEYGFVRWEYTKPDGELVIFDLEEVSGFSN